MEQDKRSELGTRNEDGEDTGLRAKRRTVLDVGNVPLVVLHVRANTTHCSLLNRKGNKNQVEAADTKVIYSGRTLVTTRRVTKHQRLFKDSYCEISIGYSKRE